MDKIEAASKAAHNINAEYCRAIGDSSQTCWEDAPEWQRESSRNGVKAVIDCPSVTPEDLHLTWMTEKVKDGWVYGEVKDSQKKKHPCIVDYAKLSLEQRMKDVIFRAVVCGVFGIE